MSQGQGKLVVLDTNMLIYCIDKVDDALLYAVTLENCSYSMISYMEVLAGCNTQCEVNRAKTFMATLMRIDVDEAIAERAATLRRESNNVFGIRLKAPDAILLATAMEKSGVILTNDSDFDRVASAHYMPANIPSALLNNRASYPG